ncbi:MAG: DUF2207 domain-containing protein [Patescibacteria group bacterium]|nr:DUF2207 domain-containing protein [Patescibacteria group bacterium]MDD4304489.1 DUF2207 domain-containing protein [Patescibacteria group bacterium]MDD4694849.1 DUF2207 domain-containing protein [Patescibacteria group bacterium]
MFKKIIVFVISLFFFLPNFVFAKENVNYWYIHDFRIEIELNTDSSALITEYITADCGNASDKHGIFRVLGTQINTGEKIIQTPVELISITDFDNNPYKYQTIKDGKNKTITWKIGDANIEVKGTNYYKIIYKVQNVIYNQNEFDEFYYNILGNFWDLEIDNFSAKIFLPKEINKNDVKIDYYTGLQNSKNKDLAIYNWFDDNTLEFNSTKIIPKNNGITVSIAMPKNIFIPAQLSEELYNQELMSDKFDFVVFTLLPIIFNFILPIIAIIFCFVIWKKHGNDPKDDRTIIAEYDIPDNLDPMLFGTLWKQGKLKNNFITASIINFAVKGILKIEETEKNYIVMKKKDYILHRIKNEKVEKSLSSNERELLVKLFDYKDSVVISSLKDKFYKDVAKLKKNVKEKLIELGYIERHGFKWQLIFVVLGIISFIIASIPTGIIFILFSIIMPKKTQKGTEILWKIKGLKLYMETAEKDRQRFYEKENIFEKLLPYAIVFGMTGLWVSKMKEIYGKEKFNSILPVWYIGNNFNFSNLDSFTKSLNSIVSSVSSAPHNSSGIGGGGFSGGGIGGGGGGGW